MTEGKGGKMERNQEERRGAKEKESVWKRIHQKETGEIRWRKREEEEGTGGRIRYAMGCVNPMLYVNWRPCSPQVNLCSVLTLL